MSVGSEHGRLRYLRAITDGEDGGGMTQKERKSRRLGRREEALAGEGKRRRRPHRLTPQRKGDQLLVGRIGSFGSLRAGKGR